MKACIGFNMENAEDALAHMDLETVQNYGAFAYGHPLFTWDDGGRRLTRCKACGGYVLIQVSEFCSFWNERDYLYTYYFPVDGPDAAEELNRLYDGITLEQKYPSRHLCETDQGVYWSK